MPEYAIREYRPGDIPALSRLWQAVFGDAPELIEAFFRLLPDMGSGVLAEQAGQIVGAAYLINGLELAVPGREAKNCGYLYAVAVAPAFRGSGIGAALSQAALELGRKRGAQFFCTQPAESSLFAWYERILGLRCALRRSQQRIPSGGDALSMPLSVTEYKMWREQMLRSRAHLRLSDAALEFEYRLCRICGGGFYAVGDGIAAAYVENGETVVRELLAGEETDLIPLAAALGTLLGTEEVLLCVPALTGDAYLAAEPGVLPQDCVRNLSFE